MTTNNVTIDIESYRTDSEWRLKQIEDSIRAPANYGPEKAAEWRAKKGLDKLKSDIDKTSLDTTFGQIVSIAFAVNDAPIQCLCRGLAHPEHQLLQDFQEELALQLQRHGEDKRPIHWIGHNHCAFDLPFIWHRQKVHQTVEHVAIPRPADCKPWSDRMFDTMAEWSGSTSFQERVSLEGICQALGIPSPKEHGDGSQVARYVEENNMDSLQTYNIADVRATREIWRRIR